MNLKHLVSVLNVLLTTNKSSYANSNYQQSNGRNVAANSPVTGSTPACHQQCIVGEQDQYMPIANVIRIMWRILPSHAKISDDAKETIQEYVSKYISFITGEANERCQREQRKTVTAEDVLWVMGKLGFDDYIEPLIIFDGSSLLEWNQSRRSSEGIYWICISKSQLSDG